MFYIHHPTDRIVHTTAFVTPVVEHRLERENSSRGSPCRRMRPMFTLSMSCGRVCHRRGRGRANRSNICIVSCMKCPLNLPPPPPTSYISPPSPPPPPPRHVGCDVSAGGVAVRCFRYDVVSHFRAVLFLVPASAPRLA